MQMSLFSRLKAEKDKTDGSGDELERERNENWMHWWVSSGSHGHSCTIHHEGKRCIVSAIHYIKWDLKGHYEKKTKRMFDSSAMGVFP